MPKRNKLIRDIMRWLNNEILCDRITLDVNNYNDGDLVELFHILADYYKKNEKKKGDSQ